MLKVKETKSVNEVEICGTLAELEVERLKSKSNKDYIRATGSVKVEQEINGEVVENLIPFRTFAMKLKADGTSNGIYANIDKWDSEFISLSAAPEPSMASRVSLSGATIEENDYVNKNGDLKTLFQISANFMKKAKFDDGDKAEFTVKGVVLGKINEEDADGNETGRLIVKIGIVQYCGKEDINGRIDVVNFYAINEEAVSFISQNWDEGSTVSFSGFVNITKKTIIQKIEAAFGESVEKSRTVSSYELVIKGGGYPEGEGISYDPDEVKLALEDRKTRLANLSNTNTKTEKPAAKKTLNW